MIKRVKTKDGENIIIRPFYIKDLNRLQRMNSYIFAETRNNYRALLPCPRPPIKSVGRLLVWTLVEIKLALSSINVIRNSLAFIPHFACIPFVAVNPRDEIVGFRFFNILGRKAKHKYIVEEGTVLRDDYQNRGIGAVFLGSTLEMVSKEVYIVIQETFAWNTRGLHLAEKMGYQKVGTLSNDSGEVIHLMVWERGTGQRSSQEPIPTPESHEKETNDK